MCVLLGCIGKLYQDEKDEEDLFSFDPYTNLVNRTSIFFLEKSG